MQTHCVLPCIGGEKIRFGAKRGIIPLGDHVQHNQQGRGIDRQYSSVQEGRRAFRAPRGLQPTAANTRAVSVSWPTVVTKSPTIVNKSTTIVNKSPTIYNKSPTIVNNSPTIVNTSPAIVNTSPTVVNKSPTIVSKSPSIVNNSPIIGNTSYAIDYC